MSQPDARYLIDKIDLHYPLIGFYDTPDASAHAPLKESKSCLFAFFRQWEKNVSVVLTKASYGCGGAGTWLCGVRTRSAESYISFLADEEGLKANHELMRAWLEHVKPYKQAHDSLVVGPLVPSAYEYLKTVTFFVNPDQLSILSIGAQIWSRPSDPAPVIAPFGSGCMQLISRVADLNAPQAVIGATDMAMRKYLPPHVLAFTVTKPLFEILCSLGADSYLEKRFYNEFRASRRGGF
jgi:hypothetical protein